jgi:hypothetical protein
VLVDAQGRIVSQAAKPPAKKKAEAKKSAPERDGAADRRNAEEGEEPEEEEDAPPAAPGGREGRPRRGGDVEAALRAALATPRNLEAGVAAAGADHQQRAGEWRPGGKSDLSSRDAGG